MDNPTRVVPLNVNDGSMVIVNAKDYTYLESAKLGGRTRFDNGAAGLICRLLDGHTDWWLTTFERPKLAAATGRPWYVIYVIRGPEIPPRRIALRETWSTHWRAYGNYADMWTFNHGAWKRNKSIGPTTTRSELFKLVHKFLPPGCVVVEAS